MNIAKNMKKKISLRSEYFSRYSGMVGVLIIIFVGLSITTNTFATSQNITNVLRQIAINGVVSVGMTILMIAGEIDLSVGSLVGLSGVVLGILVKKGVPFPIVVLIILLMCATIGTFTGFLITVLNGSAFIITLAMQNILRGAVYLITDGNAISGLPDWLKAISKERILDVPLPVYIMLLVFIAGYIVLGHTSFGRSLYAIGGNAKAAELSGINTTRCRIGAYVCSSITCGIAAVLSVSRLGSAQITTGTGLEFQAIMAASLGGVAMTGGVGTMAGVLLGALVIGLVNNGMTLLGVDEYWQKVVEGCVIALAVLYNANKDRIIKRKKQK